ncbi:MAG: hypothetical protein GF411_09405 [Candidatus Lokiarchaeota archaeon]|nr:hypothetical protein [Candidatus Lokiarchaeota archaeon]
MRKGLIAILLIALIIGAGFFIFISFQETPPELVEDSSDDAGLIVLNEIYPNAIPSEEYVELYVTGFVPDIDGWILTTYDDDKIVLPALEGSSDFLYIRIYSGDGQNDVNIDDNQATIFAGLSSSILDLSGDEVGLHDSMGYLVDFMRYASGNGDDLLGGWSGAKDPDIPSDDYSLSLLLSTSTTGDWFETPQTPGEPNAFIFETSGDYGGEEILLTNGLRIATELEGIDDRFHQSDNITINPGPGVNATIINLVREHINYSLNFYREHGFTDPERDALDRIRIRVVRGGENYTTGATGFDGSITLEIGANTTKEEIKLVGEHELMHAFQVKRLNESTPTEHRHIWLYSRWFVEGQAEFWGMWSMLTNYPHMTMTSWMKMAQRIGGLNWFTHYRDLNGTGAFDKWPGTWDSYMAVFLFTKWMNETYGTETLLKIFNETIYYGHGDARNSPPTDALKKVLNLTMEEALAKFWSWLLLDSHRENGVPTYTPHVRLDYTDSPVGDTIGVRGGGGAVIEELNVTGESPFTLQLNYSNANDNWSIVVLVFYEDGTNATINVPINQTTQSGEILVDPNSPKRITRLWVVKGLYTPTHSQITMNVTPIHDQIEELTYSGDAVGDTVELQPGESAFEVIHVNSTQAFSVFLNWTGNNNTQWNFTIIRYWEDGTNDTFNVEYENGTWNGYVVDPDAGPVSITKLVIIKHNLNETAVNVTMMVTPESEHPFNTLYPMDWNTPYWWSPLLWGQYGGFLTAYANLESTSGYEFTAEFPVGGDFSVLVLNSSLEIITEFYLSMSSPSYNLTGIVTGVHYFVVISHLGPDFYLSVEAKPYAWP